MSFNRPLKKIFDTAVFSVIGLVGGTIQKTVDILDYTSAKNFWDCVRVGKVSRVEDFLRKIPALVNDTDPSNSYGRNAIHVAAGSNNTDMVEVLLKHGASLSQRDGLGETPLLYMVAHTSGYDKMIKFLLKKDPAGIDAIAGFDDMTCLMTAVWHGDKHRVKMLLDHGANPGAVNKAGQTAMSLFTHKRLIEDMMQADSIGYDGYKVCAGLLKTALAAQKLKPQPSPKAP